MNERDGFRLFADKVALGIQAHVQRVMESLEGLERTTQLLLEITPNNRVAIEQWIQREDEEYAHRSSLYDQSGKSVAEAAILRGSGGADHISAHFRLFALKQLRPRMKEIYEKIPGGPRIYYRDITGALVFYPPAEAQEALHHTFSSESLAARFPENRTQLLWSCPSPFPGRMDRLAAELPVYAHDGLVGVWAIDLPPHSLHLMSTTDRLMQGQISLLIDHKGNIMVDGRGRFVAGNPQHVGTLGGELEELDFTSMVHERFGERELITPDGEQRVALFRCIPGIDWIFLSSFPVRGSGAHRSDDAPGTAQPPVRPPAGEQGKRQQRTAVTPMSSGNAADSPNAGTLQHVIDGIPLGMMFMRLDGSVVSANTEVLHLLGISQSPPELLTLEELHVRIVRVDGTPYPKQDNPISQALNLRRHSEMVCLLNPEQPDPLWALFSSMRVDQGAAAEPLVLITLRDITEERTTRELNEAILRSSMDGYWLLDEDGAVLDINDTTCHMLGYSRNELLTMNIQDLEVQPGGLGYRQMKKDVLQSGSGHFEMQYRRSDGKPLDLDMSLHYYAREEGRFLGFCRDITDRKSAIRALTDSENRYRSLVELSPEAMAVHSEGKLVYVNSAAARLLGSQRPSDLIGMAFSAFFHPDYKEFAEERIFQSLTEGAITPLFELKLIRLDDLEIDVEFAGIPITFGNRRSMQVILRDISTRKQSEQALRESEENYRQLADSITDVFFCIDDAFNVTYWNKASEHLSGISSRDAHGKQISELLPQLPTGAIRRAYEEAKRHGEPVYLVEPYELEDNRTWLEFSVYLSPNGLSIFVKNITERKRAEDAIRYRVDLEKLITSISTRFISIRSGEVEEGIRHALQLIGEFAGVDRSYIGRIDEGTQRIHYTHYWTAPDAQTQWEDIPIESFRWGLEKLRHYEPLIIADIADLPAAAREERTLMESDGVRAALVVPISAGSEFLGILGLTSLKTPREWTDDIITLVRISGDIIANTLNRTRSEEQIRTLNADLEQRVVQRTAQLEYANKELESFSYSVSHDLRAPLRAIDGFSRILKEEHSAQLDDEGRRLLDIVISSGLRMGELIENLLSFSRLSRIGMASTPLDMNALMRISLEEVRHMYPGEHIKVHVGDLPSAMGDSAMVKQVLINLLSNAFKFTKRSPSPVIEVGAVIENPDTVYFVKDNGVGFSMEHSQNLFGVFQRLHSAEEFEGTGVGLALVQRILHRHGGRIWAKAEVNRGATFFFTLPHSPAGAHAEVYHSHVANPT